MGGHFSGRRTYVALVRSWWWDGMHADTLRFVRNCPACSIVSGGGKATKPPLHPIPVQRPFQIIGVNIMDLPKTTDGNLWAYRNTPHETTGEKPSFLLFGYDCRTLSKAVLLPPSSLDPTTVSYYREHVMLSLSSARDLNLGLE